MMKMKENKGITLIALIITIIVLLILAGITINSITGNESAMEKATQAREENKLGEELEQIKLCVVNAIAQGLDAKVSDSNLRVQLNGIIAQSEIEKITGAGPWIIQGNSGREYKITNGGNVNALDTIDKAIISPISVEERSKVPIVISNGDNIEEIKSCTIADTNVATAAKDTDGIWKITGGTLTGELEEASTTMTIEGKSGKKIENISIMVKKGKPLAIDTLKIINNNPPYVKYATNGQTNENAEMCRVLYNDNEHGLQIITSSTVDNNVIIGQTDNMVEAIGTTNFEKAAYSYNNAIQNLNNKAIHYLNDNNNIATDARCVGSIPTIENQIFINKNNEELLTNPENYNYLKIYIQNGYKGRDNNYTEDYDQMVSLRINDISNPYWLASRAGEYYSTITRFSFWYIKNNGKKSTNIICNTDKTFSNQTSGFRPVFLINPTAKIKRGTGTFGDPYILEAGE